ncbi:G-type lectin S-receptor-like serine/threonine-protein kinase RLK1 [Aegilops tauschii subsp. strangulata]|uniref:G-type lectin S-receptor-like serine/threonine-protein kinase RLK1 n=1 Tax=Aegilops tauschii subsp. strangulata TaxID=200361 RepID=UPI003CC8A325
MLLAIPGGFPARHCLTKKNREGQGLLSMRPFSWKELHKATNGFEKLLGKGSFGEQREFTNEVQAIGQIHHQNLVRTIGYYKEGKHRMLVLEYMPGGSLRGFFFKPERPPWSWRAQAALGIAGGSSTSTTGASPRSCTATSSRTTYSSTARTPPRSPTSGSPSCSATSRCTTTVTNIRGTRGYIALEWFRSDARIDTKVDMYCFGVVLLEMICCRKCQDPLVDQGSEETVTLFGWAIQLASNQRTELIPPDDDDAAADLERVERFARVAFWCIEPNPSLRPTMHHVVQMLESAVAEADVLPDPPSCYMDSAPLILSSV